MLQAPAGTGNQQGKDVDLVAAALRGSGLEMAGLMLGDDHASVEALRSAPCAPAASPGPGSQPRRCAGVVDHDAAHELAWPLPAG